MNKINRLLKEPSIKYLLAGGLVLISFVSTYFIAGSVIWSLLLFIILIILFLLLEARYAVYWGILNGLVILSVALLNQLELISIDIDPSIFWSTMGAYILLLLALFFLSIKTSHIENSLEIFKHKSNDLSSLAKGQKVEEKKLEKSLKILVKKNKDLIEKNRAMMDILEDIDEEKDKMFEQREKLKVILESIGDGVIVMDLHRRIALVNRTTESITGYTKRDLLGKNYSTILRIMTGSIESRHYVNFIADMYERGFESSKNDQAYIINSSGDTTPVGYSASPIKNSEGRSIGAVIVFRDTTKEREVDRMKTEFVSIASHQLRTPLTGIKWYTELLNSEGNENLTVEQKEFITSIEESAKRMNDLVNDLLDVSRIDLGRKFSIESENFNIVEVIDEVVEGEKIHANLKGIELQVDNNLPKEIILDIDKNKISQVFHNLVNNAIKYSPDKSIVKIGYKEDQNSVVFHVEDCGVGIPKEEQDRIFTKFYRASNVSTGDFDGNGLGLYIVKAIAQGHGGDVWFESKQGNGTIFYVKIPKS
jgi:PAS domain S-box-containing protein